MTALIPYTHSLWIKQTSWCKVYCLISRSDRRRWAPNKDANWRLHLDQSGNRQMLNKCIINYLFGKLHCPVNMCLINICEIFSMGHLVLSRVLNLTSKLDTQCIMCLILHAFDDWLLERSTEKGCVWTKMTMRLKTMSLWGWRRSYFPRYFHACLFSGT